MSSSQLPAWYYRVSAIVRNRNGIILWDFDEDISDLDETSQDQAIIYDGPDAGEYHRLREKREERKRGFFQRKEYIRKKTEEAREEEKQKQREVQAAYETLEISMSMNSINELGPIDTNFYLYCQDYFDYFYDPSPYGWMTRKVRFEYKEGYSNVLNGQLWLNPNFDFELVPFTPPEHQSLEHHEIQTSDGRFTIIIQFIDKDHLILRSSRDLVFSGRPQDARGPETFVFMGDYND
ncbi:hypothetical protein F53441_1999 [Fusarium austroafricanum]|uniref:Uncharacterized protein n=1 Tax=Fusarium austroafricanum TaxID=2364996 RepID=A0A8H4KQW1_9HYPO|nr:hypothetical protein F53441_1999 [Fusarium austroafricanum]